MRHSFLCVTLALTSVAFGQRPDFGPNVDVFSPKTPSAVMQAKIDAVYATERRNEFGPERHAFLFLPGEYHVDVPIGFYTEVAGLGVTPDATHITGNVHVDAAYKNNNATTTFWRAAENFAVTPRGGETEGEMRWAVSQAVPMRRLHVMGDLVLHQHGGWASGGWMSDTLVDGTVAAGPQQQWISRNSDWHTWMGSNWNMVFVGDPHAPAGDWPKPVYTRIDQTPIVREKPYIAVDGEGFWTIRIPQLRHNTTGVTWHSPHPSERVVPFSHAYIAHAGRDTAASINAQLAKGDDLLLTPGVYDLDAPIRVTRANTTVLGLGFATLHATNGTPAMTVADEDGISIVAILFDAGEKLSPTLLEVGTHATSRRHTANPIALFDVFFRDGGAGPGKVVSNLTVNSNDTLIDHTWIWRADHGHNVGWDQNLSSNGLVVNGNNVTVYGLFVEHHQQFQVLWTGNSGRTYFYQSEIPYDPPTQAAYTSAHGVEGWASYKVADNITQHEAWGIGVYSVFRHPDVFLTRAIEAPTAPGVRFHDMITVCLDTNGGIRNVVNNTGGSTSCQPRFTPLLKAFPE